MLYKQLVLGSLPRQYMVGQIDESLRFARPIPGLVASYRELYVPTVSERDARASENRMPRGLKATGNYLQTNGIVRVYSSSGVLELCSNDRVLSSFLGCVF